MVLNTLWTIILVLIAIIIIVILLKFLFAIFMIVPTGLYNDIQSLNFVVGGENKQLGRLYVTALSNQINLLFSM